MKKGVLVSLILIIVSIFLISFISAQSPTNAGPTNNIVRGLGNVIDSLVKIGTPIISPLIGEVPESQIFFAKLLFFVIIVSVVWITLDRMEFFNTYTFVVWFLSIVIGILGVRFFDAETIQAIMLPYNVLGVAIAAGLPFVIYFVIMEFMIHTPTPRKIGWIFFAVIFIGLYATRIDELQGMALWIYPATIIASLAMLVFDGTIQKILRNAKRERQDFSGKQKYENELLIQLDNLDKLLVAGRIDAGVHNIQKKQIERRIAKLYKASI